MRGRGLRLVTVQSICTVSNETRDEVRNGRTIVGHSGQSTKTSGKICAFRRSICAVLRCIGIVLILALVLPTKAAARPDFEVNSTEWNGLSRFVEGAREDAPDTRTPSSLDLGSLRSRDALIVLGPDRPLPESDLVEFVRRGGRLVIVDDFGSAGPLLARFGIRRLAPVATDAPRVRGEADLLVARPFYAHPLTEGVGMLVTNRPAVLQHPRLVALLGFAEHDPGILVTGVVGEGRVVALGDPSALMNAMMGIGGNRRLAHNIVRFAVEGASPRRLVIVSGNFVSSGAFEEEERRPIRARVEAAFARVGTADLPPIALQAAAAMLACVAFLLLGTMRGRSADPDLPWLERDEGSRETRINESLADEIRGAIARRLGVTPGSSRTEVRKAIRAIRLSPDAERRMLRALDALGARRRHDITRAELREASDVLDETVSLRAENGKVQ